MNWVEQRDHRLANILAAHDAYTRVMMALDAPMERAVVTEAELRALGEIARRQRSMAVWEIASALGLDASHASHLLKRLRDRGLVRCEESASDRRSREYYRTECGQALVERWQRERLRRLDRMFVSWLPRPETALLRGLSRVNRLLESRRRGWI